MTYIIDKIILSDFNLMKKFNDYHSESAYLGRYSQRNDFSIVKPFVAALCKTDIVYFGNHVFVLDADKDFATRLESMGFSKPELVNHKLKIEDSIELYHRDFNISLILVLPEVVKQFRLALNLTKKVNSDNDSSADKVLSEFLSEILLEK